MIVIESTQQVEENAPVGAVLVHFYLLAYDALFFFHSFGGEVWVRYKVEQDLNRLGKIVGAGKKVGGFVEGRVGVGRRPRFSVAGKGVAVLTFK